MTIMRWRAAIMMIVGWPVIAAAQTLQVTQLRVTSPASDAICVGGAGIAPAPSACIGGIYAGGSALISPAGLMTVAGLGTHTFSAGGAGAQRLRLTNTAAGTANLAQFSLGTDAGSEAVFVAALSSTYTTSTYLVQNSGVLASVLGGGLSIAATSGHVRFYVGSTAEVGRMHASGGLSWGDTTDPGSTNVRIVGTLLAATINTGNGALELAASVYTPTLTIVANLDTTTAFECQYLRVGNAVNVSCMMALDPTTTLTATALRISLPIASNIGATEDAAGVGATSAINASGTIAGDAANDTANFNFLSQDAVSGNYRVIFTYQVI
jgi:hypothetical protein